MSRLAGRRGECYFCLSAHIYLNEFFPEDISILSIQKSDIGLEMNTSSARPFIFSLLPALALVAGLWLISAWNYLLFHTMAEMFSIAVAFGVFFVSWNARKFLAHYFLPFLGLAYLHVAFLNLLHTLSFKGMGVFPEATANLPTQLWIAGRFLETAALLTAPLILGRRPSLRLVAACFTLVTAVLTASIFFGYFPDCFIEGQGLTTFKIASEYASIVALLAAIALFYSRRNALPREFLWRMIAVIVTTILAELTFTQYILVDDFKNLLGHVFKIISHYLVYQVTIADGLSKPYQLLFKELHEREQELSQSREQFFTVLEGLDVGVFVSNLESCEILYANRYLKSLYGENLVGRRCFDCIPESSADCCNSCDISDLLRTDGRPGMTKVEEWRNPRDNRWFLKQGRAIHWNDNQLVRLQILTDITPLKEAERLREDIERIIRHDLKSPLNAMLNLPEILIAEPNLTDHQRELLSLLKETAWRMLNLINRSFDLFKMEHDEYVLDPAPVDLAQVLRKVASETSAYFTGSSNRLLLSINGKELAPADKFIISGEELLCFSMLSNLVINSAEASPPGSDVRVDLTAGEDSSCKLTIHNLGAIPKDIRGRFAQKYATSGKRHGMGLGVYSARLMAEIQRGRFTWKTSEEEGTTITIELPLPDN